MTPAPVRKRGNSRGMAAWLGCAASAALAGLVRATSGPLPAPSETGARSRTTLRPSDRQLVGSSSGRPLRGPPVRGGKVSVSAEGQFRVSPNTLRGPARWVSLRSPSKPPLPSKPAPSKPASVGVPSKPAPSVGVPSKPFTVGVPSKPFRWVSLRSPLRWVSLRSPLPCEVLHGGCPFEAPLRSPSRSPPHGGCPFEAFEAPPTVGVPSKPRLRSLEAPPHGGCPFEALLRSPRFEALASKPSCVALPRKRRVWWLPLTELPHKARGWHNGNELPRILENAEPIDAWISVEFVLDRADIGAVEHVGALREYREPMGGPAPRAAPRPRPSVPWQAAQARS